MVRLRNAVIDVIAFLLLHPRVLITLLFVAFIGSGVAASALRQSGSAKKSVAGQPSVLDMMQATFTGKFTRLEIEAQIVRTANAFGLPQMDETYSGMASALIALRKDTGVPEMQLLRCARAMVQEVEGARNSLTFSTAVGLCAATSSR